MCAPFLIACLYPANSSQFIAGSAHSIPLLPHQCCSPAIRVVGLDGSVCAGDAFAAGATATEVPAWLATRPMVSRRLPLKGQLSAKVSCHTPSLESIPTAPQLSGRP